MKMLVLFLTIFLVTNRQFTVSLSVERQISNCNSLIVQTKNGMVQGKEIDVEQSLGIKYKINAWLGIPFAEKPLNNLRFKPPVPVNNWSGILNTTTWPNTCYQLITAFGPTNTPLSEDCLYLNVFAPNPIPTNAAVMFWIHGGGFTTGNSALYDPSMIVAETNVIVVTIQYRVSIFGFFYLNDTESPGNQGLLDQNLALKWVQDNIQNFGGDKTKVTLFGESAGAASVSYQMLSPLSKDLYRSAILESASALSPWAQIDTDEALRRYKSVLTGLGCCAGCLRDQIACARNLDPATLINNASKILTGVADFVYAPVLDSYFLTDTPSNLLNTGNFRKVPILLGSNRNEGNYLFYLMGLPDYLNFNAKPSLTASKFQSFLRSLYTFYPKYPTRASNATQNAVLYRYTNWNNPNNLNANYDFLDAAYGDQQFSCPVIDFATAFANANQDVFMYQFDQFDSQLGFPSWFGSTHTMEISYVFGKPLYKNSNYTLQERIFTRKLLRYWSNFVKYSNPNEPTVSDCLTCVFTQFLSTVVSLGLENWPKYTLTSNLYSDTQRAYLSLKPNAIQTSYNLKADYCTFWSSYLPSVSSS